MPWLHPLNPTRRFDHTRPSALSSAAAQTGVERAALRELYVTITAGVVRDAGANPLHVLAAYRRRLADQLAHERFTTAYDIADALEAAGHHEPARLARATAHEAHLLGQDDWTAGTGSPRNLAAPLPEAATPILGGAA